MLKTIKRNLQQKLMIMADSQVAFYLRWLFTNLSKGGRFNIFNIGYNIAVISAKFGISLRYELTKPRITLKFLFVSWYWILIDCLDLFVRRDYWILSNWKSKIFDFFVSLCFVQSVKDWPFLRMIVKNSWTFVSRSGFRSFSIAATIVTNDFSPSLSKASIVDLTSDL